MGRDDLTNGMLFTLGANKFVVVVVAALPDLGTFEKDVDVVGVVLGGWR